MDTLATLMVFTTVSLMKAVGIIFLQTIVIQHCIYIGINIIIGLYYILLNQPLSKLNGLKASRKPPEGEV